MVSLKSNCGAVAFLVYSVSKSDEVFLSFLQRHCSARYEVGRRNEGVWRRKQVICLDYIDR
jgi:hypothetical protein